MVGSLQEFTQMEQIGEPAFAVNTIQQALVDGLLLAPSLKHEGKPLLAPVPQVLLKTTAPVVHRLVIIAPSKHCIGVQTHQFGCEGPEQQTLSQAAIGGTQDRLQDALQFECLGAGPDAGLR